MLGRPLLAEEVLHFAGVARRVAGILGVWGGEVEE